jgi:phosphonate transport system permease protein
MLTTLRRAAWPLAAAGLGGVALVLMGDLGLLDPAQLRKALGNMAVFTAGLFPPASAPLPRLVPALVETLQIAYVGTLLGFAGALPLALVATRTMFGPAVTGPARLLLAGIRTIPSLLWALVFVVAVGLGPAAGALAIAVYTVGYLGKLLYEAFDGVDAEVLEAVGSVGCSRLQLTRYALLPEAANAMLSQLLFVFEYNVRASAIMGFVGAGGIGFYLRGYLDLAQYQELLTAVLLTFAVVLAIDSLSGQLRRRVLPPVAAR